MFVKGGLTLFFFISVFNQLDAQNLFHNKFLFHDTTCFEHMCSSSGGQNCITQPLVSSHSVCDHLVHETATYRCDDTRGCVYNFDLLMMSTCARNMYSHEIKLIVKQKFCASSWLSTEINILRCSTVSKTSKLTLCCLDGVTPWWTTVCLYVYVPDDSLVGVETCRRDINDKLLFFTDGAVWWIKYRMVSILHGMWIALDWGGGGPPPHQGSDFLRAG